MEHKQNTLDSYKLEYEQIRDKRVLVDALIVGGVLVFCYGVMLYKAVKGF